MNNELYNPYKAIGKRIFNFRKRLKLSQTAFAQRIDISPSLLSQIERGECKIPKSILCSISMAFGVEVEYFYTGFSNDMINRKLKELSNYIDTIKFVSKLNPFQRKFLKQLLFDDYTTDKK